MKYRLALAFAALAATSAASAHNVLPGVDWCVGGNAVEVAEFAFGGPDTKSYQDCLIRDRPESMCRLSTAVVSSKPCPAQTCGEFDDDYRSARHLAQNYCSDLEAFTDPTSPYFGMSPVPIFTGPDNLTNSATHHSSYSVNDGVYGACMVCMMSDGR